MAPPVKTSHILSALRNQMASHKKPLAAYLIPMSDAHGSEYIHPSDKRIEYISGFSGSSGFAIVTANGKAALWTDGRYHESAAKQIDSNDWILMKQGLPGTPKPEEWVRDVVCESEGVKRRRLSSGLSSDINQSEIIVGVDAFTMTASQFELFQKGLDNPSDKESPLRKIQLEAISSGHLVDANLEIKACVAFGTRVYSSSMLHRGGLFLQVV